MSGHPLGPGVGRSRLGVAPLAAPAPGPGPRVARPPPADPVSLAVARVRAHAPVRRALARLAARWVATRGWEPLGYARLADHARERLGLAARQLYELARVDAALAALPRIEAAFVAGALPWTRTRLLCRVATPADEADWLAFARSTTARALAREVRAVDAASLEAGGLEGGDPLDAYPFETVEVRCTGDTHGKWGRVRQLAQRVAGGRLPAWACMEAAVAEALSGLPLADVPDAFANEFPDPESVDKTDHCESEHVRKSPLEGFRPKSALEAADGCEPHDAASPVSGPSAARPVPSPPEVEALTADLNRCDAFALESRLRVAIEFEQRRWAALAPLLAVILGGRLHRARGHASFASWVDEEVGISPRKARALLRLERAAAACSAFRSAWREGRLSWVQAQALVPIVQHEGSRAWRAAWVDHAGRVTVRRLEEDVERAVALGDLVPPDEVEERQAGARATDGVEPLVPADSQSGVVFPPPRRFFFAAPRDVARLVRATLASVQRTIERRAGRPSSRAEAVGAIFDHALATWGAGQPRLRAAHRVFARDGWRCTMPGCTSYRNLHDHHVVFRSAGGSGELANRTTLCAFHHLRGVHAGRATVTGRAPSELRFSLGLRPAASPLVRTRAREWRDDA